MPKKPKKNRLACCVGAAMNIVQQVTNQDHEIHVGYNTANAFWMML